MSRTLSHPPPLRFTEADAEQAWKEWGCNCGPAALAAVLGITLEQARGLLRSFDSRRYVNPTMMRTALNYYWPQRPLEFGWHVLTGDRPQIWPMYGLARIQWHGPWMNPGVPARVAYGKTHWVAACRGVDNDTGIFDVNAMNTGGWISLADWRDIMVPWILKEVPRADGKWSITHVAEIYR